MVGERLSRPEASKALWQFSFATSLAKPSNAAFGRLLGQKSVAD
jgi:hypothetical protein